MIDINGILALKKEYEKKQKALYKEQRENAELGEEGTEADWYILEGKMLELGNVVKDLKRLLK